MILQMEKVEDSNSDNDEDSNKSSTTHSSKDRHFLAWWLMIIWIIIMYQSKHTRQKSLPEVHETMRIHDTTVRPTIFNIQTNFQSSHQQTMTNHHVNNNLKTKQWCNLHRYQGLTTSNEEIFKQGNHFQHFNSTAQEMKTVRNKVLRSGEHAER
jgi:hypothetical protein